MFRIGVPSYLIPDDILPNVDYLIRLGLGISDVQLLLFESDEYGTNCPTPAVIRELRQRASDYGFSYSVHLPLDLPFGANGHDDERTDRILRRAIESTLALEPVGYTLHLDGNGLPRPWGAGGDTALSLVAWQERAEERMRRAAEWIGSPHGLCVENLESWDPAVFEVPLARVGAARTADIGHLWLNGQDPIPYLTAWQPEIRLIHLHGVGERDHQSLCRMDRARVRPVIHYLAQHYDGVVTLEIFDAQAVQESLACVRSLLAGAE